MSEIPASLKKLVLFYPDPRGEYRSLPYPLLSLERVLRGKHVEVVLMDEVFSENLLDFVGKEAANILGVGFSVIFGYQLETAVYCSAQIKQKHPSIPVIWGGPFVSWLTESCLKEDYVDYVVKGQGEQALQWLVDYLSGSRERLPEKIPGLGYKKDGKLYVNRQERHYNPYVLPPVDYSRINLNNYVENGRLHYIASVGCTHYCNFCFVSQVWKGQAFCNNAGAIISDIRYFLSVNPGIRYLAFDDTNFFTHKEAVKDFCALMLQHNIKLNWCGTTRIREFIEQYDEEDLKYLALAGCDTIYAGGESGDENVLQHLNKKLTVAEILLFNKKVAAAGIKPSLSFMVLFPDNPGQDLQQTLKMIMQLKTDAPDLVFTMNAYIPMRKNYYYFEALRHGYCFPKDIDSIVKGIREGFIMPWHRKKYFRLLNHFSGFYFRFSNPLFYKTMPASQQSFYKIIGKMSEGLIRKRFNKSALDNRWDAVLFLGIIKIYNIFHKAYGKTRQKSYMTYRAKNF